MKLREAERLVAGLSMRGIDATQFLLRAGVDAEELQSAESRLIVRSAFSLALAGTEPTEHSVLQHITQNVSSEDIASFAGNTRAEKMGSIGRFIERIGEEFPRLSMQITPDALAEFIKSEAMRRNAIDTARRFYTALSDGCALSDTVSATISELLQINSTIQRIDGIESLSEATETAHAAVLAEMEGKAVTLSTGYSQLDSSIHRLHGGRLYVISAEEKTGKSLLTSSIAFNVARSGAPVGLISMEMSGGEIAARLAGCSETETPAMRAERLSAFKQKVYRLPFYIRSGGVSSARMVAVAYELLLKKRIKLLVVDYLQLISMGKGERVNEVNEVVASLKAFAMNNNIPILLIASLNIKTIAGRSSKKPQPSDLRDSGRIANDCDCLLFLYTPDQELQPDYRELFVSRGRHGERGSIGLTLNTASLQFEEVPLKSFQVETNSRGAW